MEERNEEISEKAVSRDYGRSIYKEIRIEYFLNKLLEHDHEVQSMLEEGYKLNNIFVKGNEDIGTQGRATFILRKIPDKKIGPAVCKRCGSEFKNGFCAKGHIKTDE